MILQISASAGSGKTYTLTRRFLDLLSEADVRAQPSGCALFGRLEGFSLAEILAATFTNKAAAEMRDRVLTGLKEAALAEPSGEHPERRFGLWVEHILRHYSQLNIRTIDSLLATLVRLSAVELELSPEFTPSFDAGEYFTPVYEALMEDLARSGQTARQEAESGPKPPTPEPLFLSSDGAALRARLAEACRSLLHLGEFKGFAPRRRLHDLLLEMTDRLLKGEDTPICDSKAVYSRLQAMHNELAGACSGLLALLEQESLKANRHFCNFLGNCAALPLFMAMPDSVYRYKDELDECLNAASRGKAPGQVHEAFARARAAMSAYALGLPVLRLALQLSPLAALAHELHLRVDVAQREQGLLPAPRLSLLAGRVLEGGAGVSDALCRLGTRLSRMLLDEFQDTSREQWAAILPLAAECLSTGGSLTYVGDVKQAIYGWRGGDVRLFDEALAEPELRAIATETRKRGLEHNWRSHPAIVSLNNALFSLLEDQDIAGRVLGAMLPEDTPDPWRRQAALSASRNFSKAGQSIPEQKDWPSDPRSAGAGARIYEVEGDDVESVHTMVRERLRRLFLEELLPVWRHRDIAVLVRSGNEGGLAASWLTEWGLPVVTENSFLLAAHPLVGRLISLLTFLDYPPDDAAFMEFLQSEFLDGSPGMPGTSELWCWLARKSREYGPARPPLYRLFREEYPEPWQRLIEPFHAQAGLMSAYDMLREAMRRFELLERQPDQAAFLRRLLELAHLAETRGHSSLAAFLAFWHDCRDNEQLPLPENMNAVRIITMHKAKGLEFPVVILPFQHKGRRGEPGLAALDFQGIPLLTRAVPELPELYYPARVTEELERLNLLYVSWTRPVYALHAFVTRPQSASTPLMKALEILLDALRERHGDSLCEWESLSPPEDAQEAPAATLPEAPAATLPEAPAENGPDAQSPAPAGEARRPLPALPWRPMDWLPRLRIHRTPAQSGEAALSARQRGILAHLCLEHLHLSEGPENAADDAARAVRQGLRLFPLPLADPEGTAEEMEAALLWFTTLPDAANWLRHGRREQEIMDESGRMHRVDLLVDEALFAPKGHEARLVALDYKTGRGEGGATRAEHLAQVRRYTDLLEAASGRPVSGLLVYLDEQRLEAVPRRDTPAAPGRAGTRGARP